MTRAEPGAIRTAERLHSLGYEPVVRPLLAIQPIPQGAPDLSDVAALAFTSVNGVAAFAALTPVRDRPVFTVGDATARAALEAGFADVRSANGDLWALARLLDQSGAPGVVLAPGALMPAGDLVSATAATVRSLPVYDAVETRAEPPPDIAAIILHSPRAARALVAALGSDAAAPSILIALSPAVAAALGTMARPHIAAQPTEAALMEALGKALPAV